MDRRRFLVRSVFFLAGSLCGVNIFSKAFASGGQKTGSPFQARVAIIIDDIGHCVSRARQFLDLKAPITFSILPRLPNSQDLAKEIHAQGREIMLHQPMEPYNPDLDPGPGAIYLDDPGGEILRITEENIAGIPFALGVNNHMGSRFTEDKKKMSDVLKVVKERALFFVDSVTSHRSAAYQAARKLHVAAGHRNIFLDNRVEESAVLSQLIRLKRYALLYGQAIGIGHPFPETARAIGHFLKALEGSSVSLVHVSRLIYPG